MEKGTRAAGDTARALRHERGWVSDAELYSRLRHDAAWFNHGRIHPSIQSESHENLCHTGGRGIGSALPGMGMAGKWDVSARQTHLDTKLDPVQYRLDLADAGGFLRNHRRPGLEGMVIPTDCGGHELDGALYVWSIAPRLDIRPAETPRERRLVHNVWTTLRPDDRVESGFSLFLAVRLLVISSTDFCANLNDMRDCALKPLAPALRGGGGVRGLFTRVSVGFRIGRSFSR